MQDMELPLSRESLTNVDSKDDLEIDDILASVDQISSGLDKTRGQPARDGGSEFTEVATSSCSESKDEFLALLLPTDTRSDTDALAKEMQRLIDQYGYGTVKGFCERMFTINLPNGSYDSNVATSSVQQNKDTLDEMVHTCDYSLTATDLSIPLTECTDDDTRSDADELRIGAWQSANGMAKCKWKRYDVVFVNEVTGPAEGSWHRISNENPRLATHVRQFKGPTPRVQNYHHYHMIDLKQERHRILLISCVSSSQTSDKPDATEIIRKMTGWRDERKVGHDCDKCTIIICFLKGVLKDENKLSDDEILSPKQPLHIDNSTIISYGEGSSPCKNGNWQGFKLACGLRVALWQKNTEEGDYDVIFYDEHPCKDPCNSNWQKFVSGDSRVESSNTLITYIRKIEGFAMESSCITPYYQAIVVDSFLLINASHKSKEVQVEEIKHSIDKWNAKENMQVVLYHYNAPAWKRIKQLKKKVTHWEVKQKNGKDKKTAKCILRFSTTSHTSDRTEQWHGVTYKRPKSIQHQGEQMSDLRPQSHGEQRLIKQESASRNSMTVITLNLQAIDTWPQERNEATIAALVEKQTSVINMQEIHSDAVNSLWLGYSKYVKIIGQRLQQTSKIADMNLGTLLLKETFQPQDIVEISLHDWFMLIWARDMKDMHWLIVNCHMKAKEDGEHKRMKAFEKLAQRLNGFHGMVLIAGDTNIYGNRSEDLPIKSYVEDVWETRPEDEQQNWKYSYDEEKNDFNTVAQKFAGQKPTTKSGHRSRPDRVYLRAGFCKIYMYEHDHERIQIESCVERLSRSDHYAVLVVFEI